MNKLFLSAALGAALFASAAAAQDHSAVVGNWDTVAETPMGNFAAGLSVGHGAEGYTVAMEDRVPADSPMPPMNATISDVAVDGNTVTFKRSLETPQGTMELHYTLTADGDHLAGEASSDFGGVPITGSRAQ